MFTIRTVIGVALLSTSFAITSSTYFPQSEAISCPSASSGDRYCTSELYDNNYQDFDMEFMEGDSAQAMFGMWWKEICDSSSASACVPTLTCAGDSGEPITDLPRSYYYTDTDYTFDSAGCYYDSSTYPAFDFYALDADETTFANKMIRIRRFWQFPGFSFTNPIPDDVYNYEVEWIYESSDSQIEANYGWMMADVVPLNSCAYIVSQSTSVSGDTLTINYNFEQWLMAIKANADLQQRQVQLYNNYSKQFTKTLTTQTATDLIRSNEKVSWYPYWGAFYYISYGQLNLKIDMSYDTSDDYIDDPTYDPCQSDYPLFACSGYSDDDCISHVQYDLGSVYGNTETVTFIDQVWVFEMLYFTVYTPDTDYYNVILKCQGNPRTGSLAVTVHQSMYLGDSTITILSMQGLEQYGYFLTTLDSTDDSQTVTVYELYMDTDSDGNLETDSEGNYVETIGTVDSIDYPRAYTKTFTPDTSYEQRLIQQTSYMYQNRPMYAVGGKSSDLVTYRNYVYEYTSSIVTPELFEIDETAQDGTARSLDFYQYNVTMQQFHLFTVMPGAQTDDIGDTSAIDYTSLRVSIVDLTSDYQDEVMRWQLEGCGDGIYNDTTYSFEECDRAAQPPMSPSNTYKYPSESEWYRIDVFYDMTTRDYYTCSDICKMQSIDLCGDSYESNGPYDQWDTSLYTADSREECDDGNNDDGDGCSSTCTVEAEWECMDDPGNDLWGFDSCRPKCGNGIVDDPYAAADGSTFTEECDLGDYNSDEYVYEHACSTDCQKKGTEIGVDYHLWECTTSGTGRDALSTCTFLCGNEYLDTDNYEPCDRLDQPWTAQTAATEYVGYDSSYDNDTTTNTALNIGCTALCLIEDNFRCPDDNDYTNPNGMSGLLCSDRCHDGEFDGPYTGVNRATSQYSWPYRNESFDRASNSYNTWDSTNDQWTNLRVMEEECDTDGDLTCCDRMCKIVDGCTCTHFYIGIWHQSEWASYQSLCADPDVEAYDYILPTNTFYFQNYAISQNPTVGTNGQLRLMECSDSTTDCFGVSLAQQGTGSSTYVDQFIQMYQTASGGSATTSATTLASGTLMGKQRNIFGAYSVYNSDLDQLQFDKLTSSGLASSYTTTAEDAVQYLGAHEFYWFGYKSYLLAKVSDGVSFRIFQVNSDFDTIATQAYAAQADADAIETGLTNIFQVPYQTVIPPIFVQDVACFYIVDSSDIGYLYFYVWNSISNFFELKQTTQASASTVATDWQTQTSLIRTLDGVIFMESAQSDIYYYATSDYSYTSTAVTVSWDSVTDYTGTVDLSQLILRQTRDDWINYSTSETTIPTIVGWMNDDYVFTFTYDSYVLTASTSIAMPCNSDQVTAGCTTDRAFITLQSEWFDIGINYIAVLSPIDCSAEYEATSITNASVRYYLLSTEADVDANYDGIIDSTAGTDSEETVDWGKGWTCMDVPTSFEWQANTSYYWSAPSGTW